MATNGAIQLADPARQTTAMTPFQPENIDQAMRLCEMLAKSALVPNSIRGKPADIFVILATGRELGIGPMQALSDINVIQGKPVYSADLMVAQTKRRADVCKYLRLVESSDKGATYETLRAGSPEPERFTFTIEDAKKLGLTGKDNYQKQPKTMLRRRAAAAICREVYPDLVRGYDPDEAEDFAKDSRSYSPPPAPAAPVAVEGEVVAPPDNDPPSTAPEDEIQDPADALAAKVKAAASLEALSALLPAIQAAKAGGVDVTKVREAYTARRKELA